MNYGSKQNNMRDYENNVNTRGYRFANKNGFDPSALSMGYWNEMISIKMNPALDPSKQTENKIFDDEKTVMTSLTLEKAQLLVNGINDKIIPAIKNDEDKRIGVQVGGDSLVVIGTGKNITGSIRPYFAIHKSIDPSTKKPEVSIFYEFKTIESVDDYDEKTGKCTVNRGNHVEFLLFRNLLSAAIVSLAHANTHSERVVNKWAKDKNTNVLNAIASKVGAQPQSNGGSAYSQKRTGNVSWGNKSEYTQTDTADIQELSNMDDINEFLN